MHPISKRTLSVPGAELYFELQGEGPPLVLLHGLTGTCQDWSHVFDLDALAQEFCLVRPDARMHGRSGGHSSSFSFPRCAEDVLALLDALGLTTVRAVGMSLGAKTLLHIATLAPGRVERQVLVSPAPRFPEATRALFLAAASAPHTAAEREAMRALHTHGEAQIDALWQLPRSLAERHHEHAFDAATLRTLRVPSLIVAGDRDPLYPLELTLELFRALPDAALSVVARGAHAPIFGAHERPAFERLALDFLRR